MRPGETLNCPHCGERTVVKSRKRMEGFTVVGELFACALCGAELGRPDEEKSGTVPDHAPADRLAALLGEVSAVEKADLTPDEEYGRFCRNCVHLIEHPFKTLCGLNGSAADPMGECPRFERKEQ
ncbi:hypothetical protein SDC9_122157 [bioreactor metagenome]|uniref:Uncharacterized protein n=1 Tax=bioreactor metagenome TaxID=1076179 RepID=A0A645CDV8_9ZZZZ